MRILICGDTSFASQGLRGLLASQGHEVIGFGRGPLTQTPTRVTGPVEQLHINPYLQQGFDAVVNYLLLKDDSIERNIAYVDSLLQFCLSKNIRQLIHLSSISSYKASVALVREDSPIEQDPLRKGPYGALKVATDHYLLDHCPASLKLTFVRPGFILGPGLMNPIVGTAARLPWNKLLVIGNQHSRIPVISREQVHQAIARALAGPSNPSSPDVLLLAAPDSPTREEFLDVCCHRLGCGTGVSHLPVWIWYLFALGGEIVARAIGQKKLQPYQKLTARLGKQRFDPSQTSTRLGMDFRFDWRSELQRSLDGQSVNFELPYKPQPLPPSVAADKITFIGFGRIVRQRHLPALKRLGYRGVIRAFDVRPSNVPGEPPVESIEHARPEPSDLFIVASPGPAHASAIDTIGSAPGVILVEKPLGYHVDDLNRWRSYAASRTHPVFLCHNYRFKANVARMLELLQTFNPGALHHVALHFQSPPVANDSAAWLRDERRARTLLMDYSLHFLDLACMFGRGDWQVQHVRHALNTSGQTSLIEGSLSANYSVNFFLSQGFAPRRARLLYVFQNYFISLGFFPDTFSVYMSNDNPSLYKQEATASRRATFRKIMDKLSGSDSDASHAHAIAAALNGAKSANHSPAGAITLEALTPFYMMLFNVADAVYGTPPATAPPFAPAPAAALAPATVG